MKKSLISASLAFFITSSILSIGTLNHSQDSRKDKISVIELLPGHSIWILNDKYYLVPYQGGPRYNLNPLRKLTRKEFEEVKKLYPDRILDISNSPEKIRALEETLHPTPQSTPKKTLPEGQLIALAR